MSKLDKEQVLEEFSKAFKAAEGKAPKVEASNGWFSVNGGKNMRLAQLAEWTEELSKGSSKPAAKKTTEKKADTKKATSEKTASKKAAPKKAAPKKAAAKKPAAKKSAPKKSASGGMTAREQWQQHLESLNTDSRLPRGY